MQVGDEIMELAMEKERLLNQNTQGYMDMHIHSNLSDGDVSPKQLPTILKAKGITTFSITDHDCIDSCNNIHSNQLEYYPGAETSSLYKNIKMHILAYGFNPNDSQLKAMLWQIQFMRRLRFEATLNNLKINKGIVFNSKLVDQMEESCKSLGSANILSLLTQSGYTASKHDLYQMYVQPCNPHIKYRVQAEELIGVVRKAGGILILAHPYEIERENPMVDIELLMEELFNQGIDGLEAYNSLHNETMVHKYLDLAARYHVLVSGGSDYHGEFVKPNIGFGEVTKEKGKIKSLSLVDELRKRR